MGSVHLMDKLLSSYRPKLQSKKWYWNFFINAVNFLVLASWRIYQNRDNMKESHISFRSAFAIYLVKSASSITNSILSGPGSNPLQEIRFDGLNHYLISQAKQARCAVLLNVTNFPLMEHSNLSNLINFINDDSRDDDNPLKSFIDENLYIYKDKYFKYGEKYEKSGNNIIYHLTLPMERDMLLKKFLNVNLFCILGGCENLCNFSANFEHDFNFMDVINFFCDLKRIKQDYYQLKQKEMLVKIKTHAKQQNVVHRNLIYKGITHKSVCHADRETRFLTMGNRPLKTNKDYLYFGGNTKIPLSLNFNLPKINLQNSLKLLQNENIPKNDIIAPSKDLSTTFSSTYFIIERSHIQNI
ncbi:hypothetical protein A3Q56_03191 [Intoshia linei]|uniref:PiggyBac transposable element-derived protein domain-containing protein n=1 Tax=Intoshia linei TaxID=1819745 RepID=A0A177B6L3_9BILA|nr:hypothetical protein A3Q56_03191 [Intoshia linei]